MYNPAKKSNETTLDKKRCQREKQTQQIIIGDCISALKELPDNSVDLIITSPPYADQRKSTYGGIAPDKYVAWFMPRAAELYRVLKPTGSSF